YTTLFRSRIDRQRLLAPVGEMKDLAPGIAVGTLRHRDQRYVLNAEVLQRFANRAHLPLAAVDQHQARPLIRIAVRILLLHAGEAAGEDLAHHPEIVVRLGGADVELAILVLEEPLAPGDDHRSDRLRTLDVAVVVDFDARRLVGQLEEFGEFAQYLRLGAAFRQPPGECPGRVAACLLHQPATIAA